MPVLPATEPGYRKVADQHMHMWQYQSMVLGSNVSLM